MKRSFSILNRSVARLLSALILVVGFSHVMAPTSQAQSPLPASPTVKHPPADTAIVFQPSKPLIAVEDEQTADYPNTWGLTASFSDYGLAAGPFFAHRFSPSITGLLSLDIGTAKGSREFGFDNEQKINRIFVAPLMASIQFRVLQGTLSDNLRPYITAGAGPVLVLTTPTSLSFFPAFDQATTQILPGGFVGLGANFGANKKSTFGANLRYYIIPYPGVLVSTATQSLTNLNGLFITGTFGFNF